MSSISLVFHPWLLHLDKSDPSPGQIIPPSSPIWFDEEIGLGEYVAEEILDSRMDKRRKDPRGSGQVYTCPILPVRSHQIRLLLEKFGRGVR